MAAGLEAMLFDAKRIAMQYSPNNAIMYVSLVTQDGGFSRSWVKIVSRRTWLLLQQC